MKTILLVVAVVSSGCISSREAGYMAMGAGAAMAQGNDTVRCTSHYNGYGTTDTVCK